MWWLSRKGPPAVAAGPAVLEAAYLRSADPADQPSRSLPDVPGYDFKATPDETLSVKTTKQTTGGTYYQAEFTNKKGGSRMYLIETFPNGKPFSIEVFRNNQPSEGKAWWSNGKQSLSTSFHNFSPSGTWEFWNQKGETIGKIEFGAAKPKVLVWDKEQMATLAKTNNFYADFVSVVVEELRKP
jgi:hypothetical protein